MFQEFTRIDTLLSLDTDTSENFFNIKVKTDAAKCMYCLNAAIMPTEYCFYDINIEQFCCFIEQVEAVSPIRRLLMAASLLVEILIMAGQQQTVPQGTEVVINSADTGLH